MPDMKVELFSLLQFLDQAERLRPTSPIHTTIYLRYFQSRDSKRMNIILTGEEM
jgi:hypothetical protein